MPFKDARLRELARLHIDGLSVAQGPFVLRKDVWEVFDTLDRARAAMDGQRLILSVVSGNWSCRAFVPLQVLVQATWRSKAKGFFPPDAECRRRGL